MTGSNSTTDDDWVRLNIGGKIFETTKDTLLRHPESVLARLVNGGLPSKQDKSGAFLIDRSYEHFDTILNYMRTGIVNFDRNEKAMKDLLCETDFYNINHLMNEIRKTISSAFKRSETIVLIVKYDNDNKRVVSEMICSEKRDDYEVLRALRDKYKSVIMGDNGNYVRIWPWSIETQMEIEIILRSFDFVQECVQDDYAGEFRVKCWKFVRTVSK